MAISTTRRRAALCPLAHGEGNWRIKDDLSPAFTPASASTDTPRSRKWRRIVRVGTSTGPHHLLEHGVGHHSRKLLRPVW